MPQRFFVSYNKADVQWAEWIAWQLEDEGHEAVIQAWDFAAGGNFILEMQKAAAGCDRTIAVLSPDYLTSQFTQPEWAAAFAKDPKGDKQLLVPVRVRECELEGLLPQIIYVDLVGTSEDAARTKLLTGIIPGRKKPPTQPGFPGGTSHSPSKKEPPFPGPSSAATPECPRPQRPAHPNYLFFNVPPMPQHFVGRDDLVASIIKQLVAGSDSALSAKGQGGVGKTTLAVAIAHQPEVWEHFTDGVLWAGLGPKADVASVLAAWGEAIGVDVSRIQELKDRAQAIRNAIGWRTMLLVIDDAWERDAAHLLKQCGGPNCRHLLTTRDDAIARVFAGANGAATVAALDEEPAFTLLCKLAPEACDADPVAARALADSVDGLPLAIELVGGYLAEPEHSLFPELSADAFTELAEPKRRLALAKERLGSRESGKVSLHDAILLSLYELPEQTIEAFYALGAFAPKPATFDIEAAVAVTGADKRVIGQVIARNLAERGDQGGLSIHKTVADAARQRIPDGAQERHGRYYLDWVEATADWNDIAAVYAQVTWAYAALPGNEWLFRFIGALLTYHRLRGLWTNYLCWMERGITVAKTEGHQHWLATLLNNLAFFYDRAGDRQKAFTYYREALPLLQEAGDREGEATTLNNIGFVYKNLGDSQRALDFFNQALHIRQETDDREGEATTLNNLGLIYHSLGDRQKALDFYNQALPIRREVGDREGEATTLNNLGGIYSSLGDHEIALDFFNQALPIRREVGDREGEAATLINIGFIHNDLGDHQVALGFYHQALHIRREVGDRGGEAATLNDLGFIHDSLGDHQKALDFYNQALPIRREVGDRAGETVTRFNLALLHRSEGRLAEGVEELRIAVTLEKQVQHPDYEQDSKLLAEWERELAEREGGE